MRKLSMDRPGRPARVKGIFEPIAISALTICRLIARWATRLPYILRARVFAIQSCNFHFGRSAVRTYTNMCARYVVLLFLGVCGFCGAHNWACYSLVPRSQDSFASLSGCGTCRVSNSTPGHRVSSPYSALLYVFSKPAFRTEENRVIRHGLETSALRRYTQQASCT